MLRQDLPFYHNGQPYSPQGVKDGHIQMPKIWNQPGISRTRYMSRWCGKPVTSKHRTQRDWRNTPLGKICLLYMVFFLKPGENEEKLLDKINQFLSARGLKISEKKTKLTASTDGFDFLGWHFNVYNDGRLKSTPSAENFKAFRKKVKHVVNNSNYGAKEKARKLAPIVRGWRNYHKFCDMSGSRFSLWFLNHRAFQVFNKETKQDRHTAEELVKRAFPSVPHSENRHIKVQGNKSPYDGDITYWSERNSKLYDGRTSKLLKKQNHTCGHCGHKLTSEERVHLHHKDGNHNNWKNTNLTAVHESCHDYIHMQQRG